MIGRNDSPSVFHFGTHWENVNEFAVPCLTA
jgi:hypothetical protein